MPEPYDVHTCHAECPCRTGGEPSKDFLSVEGCDVGQVLEIAKRRAAPRTDLRTEEDR